MQMAFSQIVVVLVAFVFWNVQGNIDEQHKGIESVHREKLFKYQPF